MHAYITPYIPHLYETHVKTLIDLNTNQKWESNESEMKIETLGKNWSSRENG